MAGFSLMNGLSSLGAGVDKFAGNAGLELQKSQLAQQTAILADQLATTRESAGRVQSGDIAAKAATQAQGATAANIATVQAGENLRNAATINAPTPEMKNTGAATNPNTPPDQAALIKSSMLPPSVQIAGYLAAHPDQREDVNAAMTGRSRFSFAPSVSPDPDNPGKTISGVNRQDMRTGDITFVPTGTDPNKPGAGGLGNRAEVYFKRVATAATEAAQAAQNIMELPSSSTSGIFAGRGQSHGLLAAAKESLTNALTSQDVQSYNTIVPGVARSLATIEASGLAPPGSFTNSMDAMTLKEGDTEETKMRKMAELRQIVEKGMEPNLADPKIPEVQKDQIRSVVAQIQAAIPFTHHDITMLKKSDTPGQTMADLVASKGLGPNKAAAPVGQAPGSGAAAGQQATPAPTILRYDASGNRLQ